MFTINKLLVIDDDRLTREQALLSYWSKISEGPSLYPHVWYTFFPSKLLKILNSQPEINCISLDNDLGENTGENVSLELSKLAWNQTDLFEQAFKNRKVIIHSMNFVAASRMKELISDFCNDVTIIPFGDMLL